MCGIFVFHDPNSDISDKTNPDSLRHRGPDETKSIKVDDCQLVFHRLAINGMDPESGQPFQSGPVYLLANGEIYNHKELESSEVVKCKSQSDCEIIIHLYKKYGIRKTIEMLDGEFSFCLIDLTSREIHVGRDAVGVRSLYFYHNGRQFGVSSELKAIPLRDTDQFPNASYGTFNMTTGDWQIVRYTTFFDNLKINETSAIEDHCESIRTLLGEAVKKRMMCDRKTRTGLPAIGAFLSGGFDSSIVASLAMKWTQIHTFSIGFKDAPDLIAARKVANYIGSIHHEYVVTREFMLSLLPEVIKQVETYDITTIRASTFMYALSKWIKENYPDIIVLLSGEGPDEASGSYMYFYNAPNDEEFQAETIRLLEDLRYFDLKRGDKSTAGNSLEIRVPFLDRDFLKYYMTIPPRFKLKRGKESMEKWILRQSFTDSKLLPADIIWRPKEAMSDGVSNHGDSWFQIIQKHLSTGRKTIGAHPHESETPLSGLEIEKQYYRDIFLKYYPKSSHILPYYWLPRWSYNTDGSPVQDPSARLLSVYRSGT